MSTIKIEYKGSKYTTITLPPELINYVINKPVYYSRYVKFYLKPKYDLFGNLTSFCLVISNFYHNRNGNINNYVRLWGNCRTRAALKRDSSITMHSERALSSIVDKSTGRQGICNTYNVDYKIYEDGDYYSIVSHFTVKDILEIPQNNMDKFHYYISDVFTEYRYNTFAAKIKEDKNSDEFYHCIKQNDDNSVIYVTKDKFMDVILKNRISYIQYPMDALEIFKGNTRTISFSKLCARLHPEHNPKTLQAHLEYTKMLSNYDESLFSIVTGDDIVKYYNFNNYFKNTGDLGTSCMRHDHNMDSIKFYAKNSNVSLIIMKPKDLDSIMARALVWTTVDGHKVMDRIYTCDSKLVSLFHRYAENNNYINIYNVRKFNGNERNLMSMSPGNWTTDYDRNFIVDLDYLPPEFEKMRIYPKFRISTNNRRTSTSDNLKFPYLDNFNLINAVSEQASVMPIRDTFMCELTNTPVNLDNLLEFDDYIYNLNLVKIGENGPELIHEDVVTLDAPINTCDTSINIPNEVPDDSDNDDWDWESVEEIEWDELENILEQARNQNNV